MLRGYLECDDFSMFHQVVFVPALSGYLAGAIEDHAANSGVGGGDGDSAAGELEGALHPMAVQVGSVHVRGLPELSSVHGAGGQVLGRFWLKNGAIWPVFGHFQGKNRGFCLPISTQLNLLSGSLQITYVYQLLRKAVFLKNFCVVRRFLLALTHS